MMCRPPAFTTWSCSACHSPRSFSTWVFLSSAARASSASTKSHCFSTLPPSTMSVPRPAMLVAMVIIFGRPAWATICASRSCCFAFSTWCGELLLAQHSGEKLGVLDRRGAHQNRLAALIAVADVLDHRLVLFLGGAVHLVLPVVAHHLHVRRHHHDLEAVDLLELVGLGVGGAGHAGELAVHAEVVLEGDRGEGLVLVLDLHLLLGFDCLVQAVGPAPALHQPAGELVDDDHLVVLHHVVLVAVEEMVRAQRGVELVHEVDVRAARTGWRPPAAGRRASGSPRPSGGRLRTAGSGAFFSST